jgi:hypothetical protein
MGGLAYEYSHYIVRNYIPFPPLNIYRVENCLQVLEVNETYTSRYISFLYIDPFFF